MKVFYLDFETTGLNLYHDDIIEYALMESESGTSINAFVQLQKKTEVSEFINKLTGITTDMTKRGVTVEEACRNIKTFINGHAKRGESVVLVAHNGDNFDFPLFKRMMNENSTRIMHKILYLDTVKMAQLILPRMFSYKQVNLCKLFKIKNEQEHRAIGDIIALKKVHVRLAKLLDKTATIEKQVECVYSKFR